MRRILIIFLAVATVSGFSTACRKNKDVNLTIRMKDDPANYQQVNVEVTGIEVNGPGGWTTLPVNPGIYDLLELQNGVTTVLVNNGTFTHGRMNQMRLILGDENSIMVDSVLHSLATPSAQQSGLKINVNHDFVGGETYELLLDFVAGESVVEQGNGGYLLKPVLRIESIQEL